MGSALLNLSIYLLIFIGVILLAKYGTKYLAANKLPFLQLNARNDIKILGSMYLGKNKGIYLIEVKDKEYLLSFTDNNINVIDVFESGVDLVEK